MKKILVIIIAVVSIIAVNSCQKPEAEFVHDDPTITSITIYPEKSVVSTVVPGEINEETGVIEFAIPKTVAKYYDITRLKVRANVGYDVKITPSLMGVKDLSEEYEIVSTATMTGTQKKYILKAYFSRKY